MLPDSIIMLCMMGWTKDAVVGAYFQYLTYMRPAGWVEEYTRLLRGETKHIDYWLSAERCVAFDQTKLQALKLKCLEQCF